MRRKISVLISAFAVFAVVSANAKSVRTPRSTQTCGLSKIHSGLIVRGQNFKRGDFPWIVAFMYTGTSPPLFFCGGTIISSSFVLSAAHCISEKGSEKTLLPRDILAFFGAHELSNLYETGRFSLSPKEIILHDKWNPKTSQYDADLALYEFEDGRILFNDYVQPVCLWYSEYDPTETEGWVVGWGKSEDPVNSHENAAKLVKAVMQTNEDCFLDEKRLLDLSSSRTFCAGLKNGSGVCHGDSGSGLVIKIKDLYFLRGTVSSSLIGDVGCDVFRNAVFTNVLKFMDWISSKMAKATKEIFCKFTLEGNTLVRMFKTCKINESIDTEAYVIGSAFNTSIELFDVSSNRNIKYFPRHIGQKFPNLERLGANGCGLVVLRNFYFSDMRNLKNMFLNDNAISSIGLEAFNDLINLRDLLLSQNMLETLPEKLFHKMVNLVNLSLANNNFKSLSPMLFEIPNGIIEYVDLRQANCINEAYYRIDWNWDKLQPDIRSNCTQ